MMAMNTKDRCDKCGAQAYVKVRIGGGELLFCGHHFERAEVALVAAGAKVDDTDLRALRNPIKEGALT